MAKRATSLANQRLPKFKSRQEEAEFWDTHSPMDYPNEFAQVKRVKVASPLIHTLAVRLDAKTIDRLWELGQKKGVGASTLARMWLLERLEKESSAQSEVRTPHAKAKASA